MRRTVMAGLMGLVLGGCPLDQSLENDNSAGVDPNYLVEQLSIQERLNGMWGNGEFLIYFDSKGFFDAYGKNDKLYDNGRSLDFVDPVYGMGLLTDHTQRPIFSENGFRTILDRNLMVSDMVFSKQAFVEGVIQNDGSLCLTMDYVGENDFYGASLGDGSWTFYKLPSER